MFIQLLKNGLEKALVVEYVSEQEADRRFDICKKCPKFNGSNCLVCGCFMEVKTKMKTHRTLKGIVPTTCPLAKWGTTEEEKVAEATLTKMFST